MNIIFQYKYRQERIWKSEQRWKKKLMFWYIFKKSKEYKLSSPVSKFKPFTYLEVLGFIAFTKDISILRNWVKFTKNRKSKQLHKTRNRFYVDGQNLYPDNLHGLWQLWRSSLTAGWSQNCHLDRKTIFWLKIHKRFDFLHLIGASKTRIKR